MSVIVCKVTEDQIILGGDSAITYGQCEQIQMTNQKLFSINDMVTGVSGNLEHARLFQFFLEGLEWQYDEGNPELTERVVLMIFQNFCEQMDEIGVDLRDEHNDPVSQFILLARGKAFYISGFNVREIKDIEVVGCGEPSARSALYVGASVERALDTACTFNIHCEYPLQVFTVDKGSWTIEERIYHKGEPLP